MLFLFGSIFEGLIGDGEDSKLLEYSYPSLISIYLKNCVSTNHEL